MMIPIPADKPEEMIRAEGVTRQIEGPGGRTTVLHHIDLAIARAESVAIVGASGSGKSTLLALLAGLDLPTSGRIWLSGQEITGQDEDARARLRAGRVGFMFQSFHLLPSLTALENVSLPLELAAISDARDRASTALARAGLSEKVQHYPRQLSGGEQGRVALARAFVAEPQVLFADEPTGNLDQRTGRQIADLMFELNTEHKTTLVLVTHDERLASRCSRRVELDMGRLSTEPRT
jgi:putative ABC transport system ATP-binding protein